jgi:[ribosomal protein S5]-alanine N-acetyltransferase
MPTIAIRSATVFDLENALHDRQALADMYKTSVPDGWPEKDAMFIFGAERLKEAPDEGEWRVYLFFDDADALVGSGGYQGPPTGQRPDRIVEIGYEIAPAFRGKGLGTAAVSALVEHARATHTVDTVLARTEPKMSASVRILKKLEFVNVGLVPPPDQGDAVWQWQLDLAPRS